VVRITTLDGGRCGEQLARGGDAVEVRHADVHEDDVRLQHARAVQGVAPVARLANHRDRIVAREDRPQAGAHQAVVVDEQDPDRSVVHRSLPPE
jgi:hypothetical protein